MNDKNIRGSLKKALDINEQADKNNVSEAERNIIRKHLYDAYILEHPGYKEPIF